MHVFLTLKKINFLLKVYFPYEMSNYLLSKCFIRKFALRLSFLIHPILSFNPLNKMMQTYTDINVSSSIKQSNIHVKHNLVWLEKKILEKCLYMNDEWLTDELKKCAEMLDKKIRAIFDENTPIILAPMHMVSDVLVSVMCGYLSNSSKKTVVISTHETNKLGNDENSSLINLGVNLIKIDPALIQGSELKRVVRDVNKRKINLLIFPDAPPEVTLSLTNKTMRTFRCNLFNKPAKIHSGIKDLARLSNASVIVFGLSYECHKLTLNVYGTASSINLDCQLPLLIEKALKKNPCEWLLWYTPSFFSFDDNRYD